MSNISRARAITLVPFNMATLDPAAWTLLTPALEEACFLVRFTNTSTTAGALVYISYDGIDANDVVLNDGYIDLYFQDNASYSQKTNNLAKGTPIYVRGAANVGIFILSGYTYAD